MNTKEKQQVGFSEEDLLSFANYTLETQARMAKTKVLYIAEPLDLHNWKQCKNVNHL